jgi:hypothetical protein
MLKAWEAMRLSKDAQIAALMERCKRYDEDIAEKGRSNEALRRKLMHHHHAAGSTARGSVSAAGSERNPSRLSMAGSVAGSLNGSESGRVRHIHLHMHPGGHPAASVSADQSFSTERYAEMGRKDFGALAPTGMMQSHTDVYSSAGPVGGPSSSDVYGSRLDQRRASSRTQR